MPADGLHAGIRRDAGDEKVISPFDGDMVARSGFASDPMAAGVPVAAVHPPMQPGERPVLGLGGRSAAPCGPGRVKSGQAEVP